MHFFPRIIPFISISFKQHTGPSSCLQQYCIFKKYKTRWNILSEMVNRLRALVDMNNVMLLTFVNKPETFKWTFQLFMSNIQLCNEGWIISDVPRMLQSPQSINPTCALWPFLLRETEVWKQCFCEIGQCSELGNLTSQHVDVLFDLCVNTFPLESARLCVRVSVAPW